MKQDPFQVTVGSLDLRVSVDQYYQLIDMQLYQYYYFDCLGACILVLMVIVAESIIHYDLLYYCRHVHLLSKKLSLLKTIKKRRE